MIHPFRCSPSHFQLYSLSSVTVAIQPKNSEKNRYYDILPYDETRVILQQPAPEYINANYISMGQGYQYIAAQGPKQNTARDLWEMIYQQKIDLVVSPNIGHLLVE